MREPPLLIYVGLLLHGEARKRSLVNSDMEFLQQLHMKI